MGVNPSHKTSIARKVSRTAQLGWAITREAGASLLTYELYPLGLVGIPALPNLWVKKERKKLPILFIHGIFHNRAAFAWLIQKLSLGGWRHFHEIDLFTSIHSVPKMAEQTKRRVNELLKKYRSSQVDIVAHSLGGIVARYFVQLLGGDGLVRNLITLGTPHGGTTLSRYALLSHHKELSPESRTLATLNSLPAPNRTQATSVFGNLDIMIQPRSGAWWNGVRNIELKRVGHAGVLFSRRVAQIIMSRLDG